MQWHVYQAAPQHAAKLGYFQSMLTKGDRSMLEGINKMIREVPAQKELGLHECREEPRLRGRMLLWPTG